MAKEAELAKTVQNFISALQGLRKKLDKMEKEAGMILKKAKTRGKLK